jgi:putative ABC transport system permease protein
VINDIPGVETVIPRGQVQTAALTYEGRTIAFSSVTATTPGQFRDQTFIAGRPFHMGAREVVLSQSAATLVPGNVSVGDTITIELADGESADATVVGIVEDEFAFAGVRTGPRVYVPTDPFYRTTVESPALGETQLVYPTLTVVAADAATIPVVETEVESYLTSRSDARVLAPPTTTFSVQTAEEQVQQIREIVGTLTEFVSGVAVISLLVGAIGIVNIMLVSVTERTKEIGIMKAVGARKRDILELFLVEAAILGTAGAILGTLVGFGGGYVATEALELTSTYPFEWVPVAIVVGVGVGVAAGLYPAWNAARTDPIDALRYE